jgi:hypothetical protein
VNGDVVDPPVTVTQDDAFGVSFAYNDADCNLPGGSFYINMDDAGWQMFPTPLPDDLGCSSEETGSTHGFSLSVANLSIGAHTWAVYWTDVCSAASNEMGGSFTVAD